MSDKIPNMDYDADEVIENFKSKFKWPTKSTDVEVVVTPPKLPLKILISFLITAIVGFGVYYMMIPALNFKSTDFYVFLLILIAVFAHLLQSLSVHAKRLSAESMQRKSLSYL